MRGHGMLVALTVAGLVIATGKVRAQGVDLGIRGGLSSSTIAWSESPLGREFAALRRRSAVGVGAFAGFDLSGHLRLRGELLLTPKGYREVDGDETVRLDLSYIEVPLLLGVRLPTGADRWAPELYAGGWLAWERSCMVGLESVATSVDFDCDDVPDGPVLRETTDGGLAVGAAVSFALSSRLDGMIDARYSHGLRNIDAQPRIDNLEIRHRGFSLATGVSVRIGS